MNICQGSPRNNELAVDRTESFKEEIVEVSKKKCGKLCNSRKPGNPESTNLKIFFADGCKKVLEKVMVMARYKRG